MTREEAVKILRSKMDGSVDTSYEWAEAVRMAIEALKAPTKYTNTPTDTPTNAPTDLISRQDAIDAFGLSEKTRKYGGDHSGYDTMMLYEIQDVLESLPSADRPKNMIHIDDVYRLIAGHSDYHGDSILSAFTCLVEGKDVKPIAPLDESADRPTGEWEHEDGVYGIAFCPFCEFELRMNDTNFCPNCGAIMNGGEEE